MAWSAVFVISLSAFSYYLLRVVYRLFIHPLSELPGPKLAAVTSLYQAYYDTLVGRDGGCYTTQVVQMHKRYGSIVRTGPNEVHVNDPDFADILLSAKLKTTGKHLYSRNLFVETSSQVRDTTAQYFSASAVIERESLIHRYAQKFCDQVEANWAGESPLDLVDAYSCFAVDLLSDYCLSKPFTTLDDRTFKSSLRSQCLADIKAARSSQYFPFARIFAPRSPLLTTLLHQTTSTELTTRPSQSTSSPPRLSLIQTLIRTSLPPRSSTTPSGSSAIALNITSLNLYAEHIHSLLLTFTVPVSTTLALATHQLLSHPRFLARLRADLTPYVLDPTHLPPMETLRKIPYMTAVLHESLRLSCGITGQIGTVAAEPVVYTDEKARDGKGGSGKKEYVLPPGTRISTSSVSLHSNASVFPEPARFAPQRWLHDGKRRENLEKYLIPFGRGEGRYVAAELAMSALYVCLAAVVMRLAAKMKVHDTSVADVRSRREDFGKFLQGVERARVVVRES
ncbi:cytochrome P450 [Pseudovirgaria hyperparasitica]|uniref:Cytochrome P450 n=1 Tax=Pseudovirgaria hyperparasitica TaxID=470096 RepID=A0A6A6WKL6_9PEZI|nr:cytochrome P450 [Pseudovirgaria hyperparasitica]KAF2762740.1 cytochrome P450 [Pseudovirgaria hyperparasitica]